MPAEGGGVSAGDHHMHYSMLHTTRSKIFLFFNLFIYVFRWPVRFHCASAHTTAITRANGCLLPWQQGPLASPKIRQRWEKIRGSCCCAGQPPRTDRGGGGRRSWEAELWHERRRAGENHFNRASAAFISSTLHLITNTTRWWVIIWRRWKWESDNAPPWSVMTLKVDWAISRTMVVEKAEEAWSRNDSRGHVPSLSG